MDLRAQRVISAPTSTTAGRPNPAPAALGSGLLVLTGYEHQRVFVTRIDTPDGPVAGFSMNELGPFSTGGINWQGPETKDDYSLFISFTMLPEVAELQCSALDFSKPIGGVQDGAVPPYPASYSFLVRFTTGELHDPRMLITPI